MRACISYRCSDHVLLLCYTLLLASLPLTGIFFCPFYPPLITATDQQHGVRFFSLLPFVMFMLCILQDQSIGVLFFLCSRGNCVVLYGFIYVELGTFYRSKE